MVVVQGRPKAVYANPCDKGTPLTDDISGAPVACALKNEEGTVCPSNHECKAVVGSTQAVCCPMTYELEAEASEGIDTTEGRTQTSECNSELHSTAISLVSSKCCYQKLHTFYHNVIFFCIHRTNYYKIPSSAIETSM